MKNEYMENKDKKLTAILKNILTGNGVTSVNGYEWSQGEALYRGDPIFGRATDKEMNAIMRTAKVSQTI